MKYWYDTGLIYFFYYPILHVKLVCWQPLDLKTSLDYFGNTGPWHRCFALNDNVADYFFFKSCSYFSFLTFFFICSLPYFLIPTFPYQRDEGLAVADGRSSPLGHFVLLWKLLLGLWSKSWRWSFNMLCKCDPCFHFNSLTPPATSFHFQQ